MVEVDKTGGGLITASALDCGRSVFAVPGDEERTTSLGCNLLIRNGAYPMPDPDDPYR